MTWSKRSGYGALPKPCFEALRLPRARHSISQRFPVAVRAAIRESVLFVITEQLAEGLLSFFFIPSRAVGSQQATRFLF